MCGRVRLQLYASPGKAWILYHKSSTSVFSEMHFWQKTSRPLVLSYFNKRVHINGIQFCLNPKHLLSWQIFWTLFGFFLTRTDFFFKNLTSSLLSLYDYPTWSKKSKNAEEQILRSCIVNVGTGKHTDEQELNS